MVRATEKSEPILTFRSSEEFEANMSDKPRTSSGCWLKLSKTSAAIPTISKQNAIKAALCCGWIDGQLAPLHDEYFLVRMTPRRRGSRWSQKNRDTADQLLALNRIRPAGIAEIEAAKGDGRWASGYASQGKAEAPADLVAALKRNKLAAAFFEELDCANRYAIIYRVNDAKRPQTRVERITKFVAMLPVAKHFTPRKSGASAVTAKKSKRG